MREDAGALVIKSARSLKCLVFPIGRTDPRRREKAISKNN
jgi:hypothetical protein